jgi:glycosyltransferase involved in cell wall biosynthesis
MIDRLPRRREILVQYVPHAFGCRAMNLGFCAWLLARSREDQITITFHEVTFPIRAGQLVRHNLLGVVNHAMAAMLARAASRAIVTIPAWEVLLRKLGARSEIRVAPVPSNLPLAVSPDCVARARAAYRSAGDEAIIGTFGSFGPLVTPLLDRVVPRLTAQQRRRVLLIGRGSERYRQRLAQCANLTATGPLGADETAAAIAACDVMVQPFPDGVSGRRSSVAAALALGVPVVTNAGELSEAFWRQSGAVALAGCADQIPELTEALLNDATGRARLANAGKQLYDRRFALRHTIAALRECRESGTSS